MFFAQKSVEIRKGSMTSQIGWIYSPHAYATNNLVKSIFRPTSATTGVCSGLSGECPSHEVAWPSVGMCTKARK